MRCPVGNTAIQMSGHSKWATTKRHKAAVDIKRGKIFSVISKELTLAARAGGGNPEFNARLRTTISKAKNANMPADNIDRAIKKGTGELPGVQYDELTYEGYAPGGVGIIVEVTTDNKNRSASEVRSTITKAGGNLAGPGALAFNFQRQGQFLVAGEKTTEDDLMMAVLDAGEPETEIREAYLRSATWKNNDAEATLPQDKAAELADSEVSANSGPAEAAPLFLSN